MFSVRPLVNAAPAIPASPGIRISFVAIPSATRDHSSPEVRSCRNSVLHVLTANEAVFKILERPSSDIIGHPADHLFSGTNLWLLNSLRKVARTGEQEITVEGELETGSEATASVNATVSPLIDALDESICSMVVLEDITTEKRVKSTMARYMSAEVADQLLESGEAELGGKDQKMSRVRVSYGIDSSGFVH